MSIITEFDSTTKRVGFLLKNYKSLRSNDTKLWLSYLVMYHNLQTTLKNNEPCNSFCELVLDENVPSLASISRIRQTFQKKLDYPREHKKRSKKGDYFIKERVKHLLKNYKPLRDDDKKLWVSYLLAYHKLGEMDKSNDPYDTLCNILIEEAPLPESLRRCRQLLQQKGLYTGATRSERIRHAGRRGA